MLPNETTDGAAILNLEEDGHDENKELKEFYECNLTCFKKCSMYLIPYPIIRKIAVMLDDTKTFDDDWKSYATEMGLDNYTIAEIKAAALCHRELPIYYVMDRTMRNRGTFGDVIYALLKTRRFDVLREIEPFVSELLPKINSATPAICKNEMDVQEQHTIEKNSTSFDEQKCEFSDIQQHSINNHFKSALKISDSAHVPARSLEDIKPVPSAPVEEKITVLIQHAESDIESARQLSESFSKEGMIATTLSDVKEFELMNVIETVFKEVDFIVPILSSSFLEDIYPNNPERFLESTYAQDNLRLFNLMTLEYKQNRFFNFRVRPVIVEGMSRRDIKEPMFSIAFRLPNEVSKLIRVLKKTKEIRVQQLVQ